MHDRGIIGRTASKAAVAVIVSAILLAGCMAAATTKANAQDGLAAPGDIVEYHTSQKVGTLKDDVWSRYSSMEMECMLPAEVEYVSSTVLKNGAENVTSSGAASHDPSTNKAKFAFSTGYLSSQMSLSGETYELVVTGKVKSVPESGSLSCTSRASINGIVQSSNTVTTPVKAGALEVSLEASTSQIAAMPEAPSPIGLKAVVSQSVEDTHVRAAKIGCTMPEGVELDCSSVSVEGVEGASVEAAPSGFVVSLDRLEASTFEVSFSCLASSATGGGEIVFDAVASAYGIAEASDEAHVDSLDTSTPRTVSVTVTVDAATLHQGHGIPVFFAVLGRNGAASDPVSVRALTFDDAQEPSGEASVSAVFDDVCAGEYSLRIVPPSRYSLDGLKVNGEDAGTELGFLSIDALQCEETAIAASFEKSSYQYLSSTDFVTLGPR